MTATSPRIKWKAQRDGAAVRHTATYLSNWIGSYTIGYHIKLGSVELNRNVDRRECDVATAKEKCIEMVDSANRWKD